MRLFLSLLLVTLFSFALITDAQAKRFGGGRSIGFQRSVSSLARPSVVPNQFRNTASKWMGPLAGFALGGLLASLFMGHGIGTGIMSWLLLGGLVLLVVNLFRQQRLVSKPDYYDKRANNSYFQPDRHYQSTETNAYPLGFEPDAFLRDAKVQFIRLQAAYDQKNLNDVRAFTSPEVYAEIQMQFQERGDAINITEVTTLEAQLLNAANEAMSMVASVRFTGMVREDNQPETSFHEIWHFQKNPSNSNWMVTGIQQA